jgi:hypothetical protein
MQYDNRGKVSLWKNDKGGDKQPVVTGKVVAHRDIKEGETLDIALWKRDDASGNQPVMTGKISDPYKKDDGDDLPF